MLNPPRFLCADFATKLKLGSAVPPGDIVLGCDKVCGLAKAITKSIEAPATWLIILANKSQPLVAYGLELRPSSQQTSAVGKLVQLVFAVQ